MTNTNDFNWAQYSAQEEKLAQEFIEEWATFGNSENEFINVLKCLSLYVHCSEFSDCFIDHALKKFPSISAIDFKQAVHSKESPLSMSFFGCLAETYNLKKNRIVELGMVNTPPVLAYDMVSLSIKTYLENSGNQPKELTNIKFYDSCCGTGIFPLMMLVHLKELNFIDNFDFNKNFEISDIDPVSLEATTIRLASYLAANSKMNYLEARKALKEAIVCRNALFQPSMQEQMDLLSDRPLKKKDIVIANPPYVRPEKISPEMKEILYELYPDLADGKADLYNYFIAHGVANLSANGVLCYITPASFQKGKYGLKTREFLSKKVNVEYVFDFDELKVFKNVSLHSCVFLLSLKNNKDKPLKHIFLDRLDSSKPLLENLSRMEELKQECASVDRWHFADETDNSLIQKLRKNNRRLVDVVGAIYSGIKTGCNEAYIIDSAEGESLKARDASNVIVPIIVPTDLGPFNQKKKTSNYLLLIKKGFQLEEDSPIYNHFLKFKSQLEKRSDLKKDDHWYTLRSCDYYNHFIEPKIIYPDISTECRFCLDESGSYIPDSAFFLPTGDLLLLGLLNSDLAKYYFRESCNSIGNPNKRGRLRFKKTYVSSFPIPIRNNENLPLTREIELLVKKRLQKQSNEVERELNEKIFQLYGLTENEINTIKSNIYGNRTVADIHLELR